MRIFPVLIILSEVISASSAKDIDLANHVKKILEILA